jgi:hypothetical protein
MLVDDLVKMLDPALAPLGHVAGPGDEYHEPALVLVHQFARPVRLTWVPVLGRATSLVLVARQPVDLDASERGLEMLWTRVARVAAHRFPIRRGPSLPTTLVVVTPEPIVAGEDERLAAALTAGSVRDRVVRLGLFRVNLGQEALAFAIRRVPDAPLPEPDRVADALSARLGRFLPPLDPADFA